MAADYTEMLKRHDKKRIGILLDGEIRVHLEGMLTIIGGGAGVTCHVTEGNSYAFFSPRNVTSDMPRGDITTFVLMDRKSMVI